LHIDVVTWVHMSVYELGGKDHKLLL
jgi:hypothetical protein